ncbi:hypothetical protein LOK74_22570 [Brevibacillus humidisoli]|uniref:hypothetical protein n=1 Tax=Brevibacillus humidisoli TaxID=2895522 RepID=UPI001E617769|nr:hypothetical protein [Brevibacillus humidisoli]UFJ40742.1 hypothetical protein LOK74_22570 [Brevibacillus humidisoli]
MNHKEIWKWIFEIAPDHFLLSVAKVKGLNLRIPGVSDVQHIKKEQLRAFRPRIINGLLKNDKLFYICQHFDEIPFDDELIEKISQIRERDSDNLYAEIQSDDTAIDLPSVLMVLLSSSEPDDHTKAAALFEKVKEKGELDAHAQKIKQSEQKEKENREEQPEPERKAETAEYEKQYRQEKKRSEILQQKLDECKEERERERREWKEAKQAYEAETQTIKRELHRKEQEVARQEAAIAKLEQDKEQLRTSLQQAQARIKELEQSKQSLQSRIDQEKQAAEEMKKQLELIKIIHGIEGTDDIKIKVLLFGNPRNRRVFSIPKYAVRVVESSEIDQFLESEPQAKADEVWVLTYRVPREQQVRLQQIYQSKVVEFADFHKLKTYMEGK